LIKLNYHLILLILRNLFISIRKFAIYVLLIFWVLPAFQLSAQDISNIKYQKPISYGGSISLSGGPYVHFGDGVARNSPFWWNFNTAFQVSLYGWSIPFSANFGPDQRSFSQPFNRYGMSPRYKSLTIHLGYRSMTFNRYSLSGLQFLGAGIELNPGIFRFSAFYGRFTKPVAYDSLASISPVPAYKRIGMGFKIGVGNQLRFIDLSFLKIEDNPNSIDSLASTKGYSPKENFVLGLTSRVSISRYITWNLEAAGSVITDNLLAEKLDIKNWSDSHFLNSLISPRIGTRLTFAGQSNLSFQHRNFGIKINYRQVDPGYSSLGALFLQSDVRAFTVDPSLKLMKGKLRIQTSIGKEQDNLSRKKLFTSNRNIAAFNIAFSPKPIYAIDASFSNYGLAQQAGLISVNDTFRVAQVSRNTQLNQRINIQNKKRILGFQLGVGYQVLKDLNSYSTNSMSENQILFANLNSNYFRTRDKLSFTSGLTFNKTKSFLNDRVGLGPLIGIGKSFINNKLKISGNFMYQFIWLNEISSGAIMTSYFTGNYQLKGGHQFQLNVNFLHSNSTLQMFSELRMMAGYIFAFHSKQKK
jgi:hypothetical protein